MATAPQEVNSAFQVATERECGAIDCTQQYGPTYLSFQEAGAESASLVVPRPATAELPAAEGPCSSERGELQPSYSSTAHRDGDWPHKVRLQQRKRREASAFHSIMPFASRPASMMHPGPALLATRAASLPQCSSSDLDRDISPKHAHEAKKRRPSRKQGLGSKDDIDYEPGLRTYRSRKTASGPKHKSPGRSRLLLAGTASTIGDVDPGWNTLQGSVVLVAKTLTKSDTLGRVILPRVAVETNMSFLTAYRAYSLAVRDLDGRPWEFVVKSWANGSEQRRVYVLEQAALYLRSNHLREGDVVGICGDEEGNLRVAANTQQLRDAVARPTYGVAFNKPPQSKSGPCDAAGLGLPKRSPVCKRSAAENELCTSPHELRRPRWAEEPVRSPTNLRARRSSDSLDGTAESAKAAISLPLADEDIACGQATLPAALKIDPIVWSSSSISVKDDMGQPWDLGVHHVGPQKLVVLSYLDDFYTQQAARSGDCIEVEPLADGSLQLLLDPCPDARPRAPTARSEAADRRGKKRRAAETGDEAPLVPVKCGCLSGFLDLREGSIVVSSNLSTATSFSASSFQTRAGFGEDEDWLDTICVSENAKSTPLGDWLRDSGFSHGKIERICSGLDAWPMCNSKHAEPTMLSSPQCSLAKWPMHGKRTTSISRGDTMVGRIPSNGATACLEDSIAAEVLMSLGEREGTARIAPANRSAFQSVSRDLPMAVPGACFSNGRMAAQPPEMLTQERA